MNNNQIPEEKKLPVWLAIFILVIWFGAWIAGGIVLLNCIQLPKEIVPLGYFTAIAVACIMAFVIGLVIAGAYMELLVKHHRGVLD